MVDTVEEFSKNLSDFVENPDDPKYRFKDAKNLPSDYVDKLSNDVNFFNESVSTNFSTVQVPTDVYSGGTRAQKCRETRRLLEINCRYYFDRKRNSTWDTMLERIRSRFQIKLQKRSVAFVAIFCRS